MVQLRLIVCAETVQLGLEVENRTGMALWIFMVHSCCQYSQKIIKLRPLQTSFGVHLDFTYFQ